MKSSLHSLLKCSVAAMILSLPLTTLINVAVAQVQFNAPPVSAPGNRESGASRSDTCAMTIDDSGLTAVIPESNVGFTTKASPSFLAYVPANNAERVEFRLFEEETGDEVYVGQVPLPVASSGASYSYMSSVVSFSMPQDNTMVSLEPGKSYLWALILVCNGNNRAEDIVVTGVVQRPAPDYFAGLAPEVQDQLAAIDTSSPAEQLATYGEAGIWQDLIAMLAVLANRDPSLYQSDWNTLLEQQGLGAIANRPIVFVEVEPM